MRGTCSLLNNIPFLIIQLFKELCSQFLIFQKNKQNKQNKTNCLGHTSIIFCLYISLCYDMLFDTRFRLTQR